MVRSEQGARVGAESGFGEALRALRTRRGLSLAELSRLTHYSKGYLSNIENGRKPPTADMARRLDDVLGGALSDLVDSRYCPYLGLSAFGPGDTQWFFGRERTTAALLARLAETLDRDQPLVVLGASGAGKSSVLHAGVRPALAGGALPAPGSASWPVLVMTPTANPVRALREKAAKHLDHTRLVIVVDQFEEVFTLCSDETQRREFIAALCSRSASSLVVLGVRADFYSRCLAYPELLDALQNNQFVVPPARCLRRADRPHRPGVRAGVPPRRAHPRERGERSDGPPVGNRRGAGRPTGVRTRFVADHAGGVVGVPRRHRLRSALPITRRSATVSLDRWDLGYREPLTSGIARSDTPTMTPTVVLAGRDLHTLLSEVDVTILAMVDSGPEAEHAARAQQPDVVVLDLRACADGCDTVVRRLHETGCAVLVLADETALMTAIRAGARGFVTGEVTARQLTHTIRVLAGGSALFGADVAGPLLSRLSGNARPLPTDLTDREREVLDLVNAGHSHRAIAAKLTLAPKTIRNTVASINAKQRAANR